jgi:hypothetical protein
VRASITVLRPVGPPTARRRSYLILSRPTGAPRHHRASTERRGSELEEKGGICTGISRRHAPPPTQPPTIPHPTCQTAVALLRGLCTCTSRCHHRLPNTPPPTSHLPDGRRIPGWAVALAPPVVPTRQPNSVPPSQPVCPSHPCARCHSRLPDGRRLHLHFSIVDPIARPIPLRTHHRSFVSSLPSQSGPTPPQRPSPVVLAQHRSLWNHCSAGRRGSFLSLRGRADPPPGQAPRGPLQPAATLGGGAVAAGALSRTAPTAGSCPGCTQMLPEFCSHCIGPSRAFEPRGLHHRGQSALAPLPSVFCSGLVALCCPLPGGCTIAVWRRLRRSGPSRALVRPRRLSG